MGSSPVTMAAATATQTRAPRGRRRGSPRSPSADRPPRAHAPRVRHAPRPGADTRTRTQAPGYLAHTPRPAPRALRRGPSAEIGRRYAKPRIPPRSGARAPGKCSSGAALRGATGRVGSEPRLPPGGFGAPGRRRPPSAAPRPAVPEARVFRRREAGAPRTGERDGARRD